MQDKSVRARRKREQKCLGTSTATALRPIPAALQRPVGVFHPQGHLIICTSLIQPEHLFLIQRNLPPVWFTHLEKKAQRDHRFLILFISHTLKVKKKKSHQNVKQRNSKSKRAQTCTQNVPPAQSQS